MHIAVLKETHSGEARVALSPDAVKKYLSLGASVSVEHGAGEASGISDDAFAQSGATIGTRADILQQAKLVLCVRAPEAEAIATLPPGCLLIGLLDPYHPDALLPALSAQDITAFSMELLPRISRAQGMDVLSSQSNLAGYRAVIEAVGALPKAVPMMMTAAGTVHPAKALVLGAGVAGLQAIATAKRLGAVVSAFDVRAVAKEQVESLGAKFIEVPAEEGGETKGGYAKEMSEDYQKRQRQLIHDTIIKQDIVITTALIPGRPAPELITAEMVAAMKPGSVIVDLAAIAGGNCPLTEPDQITYPHGVAIIGWTNLPARVAADASPLYARNLYNFISTLLIKDGTFDPQWEDEIITAALLTRDGQAVHPMFTKKEA